MPARAARVAAGSDSPSPAAPAAADAEPPAAKSAEPTAIAAPAQPKPVATGARSSQQRRRARTPGRPGDKEYRFRLAAHRGSFAALTLVLDLDEPDWAQTDDSYDPSDIRVIGIMMTTGGNAEDFTAEPEQMPTPSLFYIDRITLAPE